MNVCLHYTRAVYTILLPLGALAVLLLVILVIIVICICRKKRMEYETRTRERSNDLTVHTAESEPSYSTVVFKSRVKKSEESYLQQSTPLQTIKTTHNTTH